MKITEITDISEVERLLSRSSLHTSDLRNNDKLALFGVFEKDILIACIGLEMYGETALLRSLAVASEYRKRGIGRQLFLHAENFCRQNGVKEIFLLTQTAEGFFTRFGFNHHKREDAPSSITETTQFSGLCPVSSRFMMKAVNG